MDIDPTPILQMLQGNQVTAVVRAGIEHTVFDAIAEGHTSAAAVAEARGTDPRGTEILLDALTALGLLGREASAYSLTPLSQTFLHTPEPTYVGDLSKIFSSRHLAEHLGTMTEAVARGGAVLDRNAHTPDHPFWTDFARGSAAMAGPGGQALASVISPWLSEREDPTVLDLACGSGLYGFGVVGACAGARVVSHDWPSVLSHTEEVAESMGLRDRVTLLPGDLFEVDLGGPHDLVIASHVFHHFDPATNQRLIGKIADATKPGGKMAIHEFVTSEASPADDPAPYLFSAMMLTWTREGRAYSRDHYGAWLGEAGFGEPRVHDSAGAPTRLLIATKA